MSEIDSDSGVFRQGFVFAHLAALVKGHGASHLALKAIENGGKASEMCWPCPSATSPGRQRVWCARPECRPEKGFPCQ